MTERRGRWPAVGLGLQVMGGEFQPRILHLNETGTSVARYLVLFAAALLPLTVAVVRSRTLLTTLRRPPLTWWCVYLSWICIATVWSIDPTHALQPALWIVSVSLYTSWYVSTAGWEAFELTVARSGVAFIVVGAIVEPIGGLGNGRLQGLMLAPTTMGRLGAVVGIIGVSVWSRGRAHRLLGAVAVITGLYAILASSTRTAAVALLVIGGWAFVRRTGRTGA